ncbi:TetR/AcrR family transcriptional regulator [Streptomyces aidingensis]|uniref:DNA-binding transcriptional regulator, AcrR family n=1 Tax=Streptomyces aidingensis TaxID=910347 RepID=A0A1I1T2H5_9ACTN|nr:TetR/AcrR family transcriptional regulator [Streptomyces aidingensis]SFD52801.1 DNA-binding transcriptional regulator, AcrR family [Streptomyces aidingensis]
MPLELLRTPPPRERADAARNRAAVLEAAARLFAERGAEAVSMDEVAAAAGVGKGTLFRRFGDKAGLAAALLDARERELQEAILHGPPPLGPGAAPGERLAAFIDAYFDYLLEHLALVRTSETAAAGARYRIGAYRFWHRHVTILLGDRAPDPECSAHALLAAMAAEHVTALLPGLGARRMRAGLRHLARALGEAGR